MRRVKYRVARPRDSIVSAASKGNECPLEMEENSHTLSIYGDKFIAVLRPKLTAV